MSYVGKGSKNLNRSLCLDLIWLASSPASADRLRRLLRHSGWPSPPVSVADEHSAAQAMGNRRFVAFRAADPCAPAWFRLCLQQDRIPVPVGNTAVLPRPVADNADPALFTLGDSPAELNQLPAWLRSLPPASLQTLGTNSVARSTPEIRRLTLDLDTAFDLRANPFPAFREDGSMIRESDLFRSLWRKAGRQFPRESGRPILALGAGRFLKRLLAAVRDIPDGPALLGVADDAAATDTFEGLPVRTPAAWKSESFAAILLATDAIENRLAERARTVFGPDTILIRPSKWMGDDSDTEPDADTPSDEGTDIGGKSTKSEIPKPDGNPKGQTSVSPCPSAKRVVKEEKPTTEYTERDVSAKDLSPRITPMNANEEDLTTKSPPSQSLRRGMHEGPQSPMSDCHFESGTAVGPGLRLAPIRKIEAAMVCVGYGDMLARTLPRNRDLFETVAIATTEDDQETQRVAKANGARVAISDRIHDHEAAFNKGCMLNDALAALDADDWLLVTDADILFLPDWRERWRRRLFHRDALYYATRVDLPETDTDDWLRMFDRQPAILGKRPFRMPGRNRMPWGYFQLFHTESFVLRNRQRVWYPETFPHAAEVDYAFQELWPETMKILLPELLGHVPHGPEGVNWHGRKSRPLPTP
jgi:hypothetical protein